MCEVVGQNKYHIILQQFVKMGPKGHLIVYICKTLGDLALITKFRTFQTHFIKLKIFSVIVLE
jgi:hypothetical protein